MPFYRTFRNFRDLALLLGIAATFTVNAAMAEAQQEKKRWPNVSSRNSSQSTQPQPVDEKIDIDFAGGSLAEYVKMIRSSSKSANIIVSKKAEKTTLPQITITGVKVETAIMILEKLSLDLELDFSDGVIVINAIPINDSITVVNITPILAEHPRETLLTAITEGLELIGSNPDQVALKMHRDTGLLFIRGTRRETSLISDIVRQLSPRQNIRWPKRGTAGDIRIDEGATGSGPGSGRGNPLAKPPGRKPVPGVPPNTKKSRDFVDEKPKSGKGNVKENQPFSE